MNTHFAGEWLLKDGFKHVYAIERSVLGWQCIDPSRSDLYTFILPAQYNADVINEFIKLNPNATVLSLKINQHKDCIFPTFGAVSCVSVIKYLLGINWPLVFTPYQLYTKLKSKPPKHIEVIRWHDTNYIKPSEKPQPPLNKPTP